MMAEAQPRRNSNTMTWIAAFFGLGIVVSAAFLTGFLGGGTPSKPKPKDPAATKVSLPSTSTENSSPASVSYDPALGDATLAKLWSNLEPEKLAEITKTWKPLELAQVVVKMKVDKQSDLLASLPADRASALSREIHRLSSNQ